MTEENYRYRTSQLLLRNQFEGSGAWKIPVIPKAEFDEEEFRGLRLIGFDKTKLEDERHLGRIVHFFLYDYKFERVWKDPDHDIEKLRRYRAVLSPDFSMYLEMHPLMQLYNTFRNRWCGAYFASKGMRVIPTVSWGDERSFAFCFEGIPKGSTVAVSTYMVSEHGNRADQKPFFMKGYEELLRRVEPERILCYHEPFPEMRGNIVPIDYELSSWRHMEDDYTPSKYAKYICGLEPVPPGCDLVIKRGYVMRDDGCRMGMGSAYGGKWKPKKETDKRYLGQPGEIKETFKDGYRIETKIGSDGRAIKERHYTDHNRQHTGHTNPHDHEIRWDNPNGHPEPQGPINYPNGAPEFKNFGGFKMKNTVILPGNTEEDRFQTISEFKECMHYHGEVEFEWNGKTYDIVHDPDAIVIYEAHSETECYYKTADALLEYTIDDVRLRDIITSVQVHYRTV